MKTVFILIIMVSLFASGQQNADNFKSMQVPEIEHQGVAKLKEVSQLLEAQTELQSIALANWDDFPYRPDVKFRIAHSQGQIWLKFYVTENHVLAQRTEPNSDTHRDSCVEFFIDPKQKGAYYNFEFNAIGTTHLGYGPNRHHREFVDAGLIQDGIRIESSLGKKPVDQKKDGQSWEMTVVIPKNIWVHTDLDTLSGVTANANFYKCGDETEVPHFLSWSPVETERPDFHRPEFFGTLVFE